MKAMHIRLLFPVTLICIGQAATAQTTIDTSYRTTYYEQKVTMFQLQPDKKDEVVFLGDSITDIAEWGEIWKNIKVRNRGVSSDNTFGVLARLDEVLAAQPVKLFIMIGINDIARKTPDSVIVTNYEKIIKQIKETSTRTKLYIQSILPTNNEFTEFIRHQNKDEHIRFVNQALQSLAKEYGCTYIDLYTSFLDASGKLDKRYTNDGLHINGYGYQLWKQILQEKGYMK